MVTAYNSVFVIRYAHPNAFGTSQIRKKLGGVLLDGEEVKNKGL